MPAQGAERCASLTSARFATADCGHHVPASITKRSRLIDRRAHDAITGRLLTGIGSPVSIDSSTLD